MTFDLYGNPMPATEAQRATGVGSEVAAYPDADLRL